VTSFRPEHLQNKSRKPVLFSRVPKVSSSHHVFTTNAPRFTMQNTTFWHPFLQNPLQKHCSTTAKKNHETMARLG
jgi:hypothetical protein